MTSLSDWKSGFDANLEKLIGVTPFHSSGEGYFDQELRGEWSASNVNFDIEQIVAEHEYVEMTKDSDSDATQTWSESFFDAVRTETQELYEGAKNFAKNAVQFEDKDQIVDPKLIHERFEEVYGWAQMTYEIQLYDIDIGVLE